MINQFDRCSFILHKTQYDIKSLKHGIHSQKYPISTIPNSRSLCRFYKPLMAFYETIMIKAENYLLTNFYERQLKSFQFFSLPSQRNKKVHFYIFFLERLSAQ